MNDDKDTNSDLPDASIAEESFFKSDEQVSDPLGVELRTQKQREKKVFRANFSGVVVLILGLLVIYWLQDEIAYFLSSSTPKDLGLAEDLMEIESEHNNYVSIHGIARDMCIRAEMFSKKVRFLYFLGSKTGNRIIIQTPAPEKEDCLGALQKTFQGRVLSLSKTSKYDMVLAYYREHFPFAPERGPAFVLLDEEAPFSAWWVPMIILVVLLLWGINLRTLWRIHGRKM
jgi:hypothetical protein